MSDRPNTDANTPGSPTYSASEQRQAGAVVTTYLTLSLGVFLLLMLTGLTLRAAQGRWLALDPGLFYQLLTLHGAGMVGVSGLASMAVLWHFLRRYVRLSTALFWAMLGLSLIGVVLIVGAILWGQFAAAWTFLYPLPAQSMGQWSSHAAASFMLGLLLIGVGFLLFCLDAGRALLARYGNLGRALGLPALFGLTPLDPDHPSTVVAGTMVIIVNTLGIAVGAVVLVISLINLYQPTFTPDALVVKNLIFFFGHVFINATIYAAVTAVYELLPIYTGRPWRVSKPFLAAWLAVTLLVLAVYPHHLLMDFAMPVWALSLGQILSYASGIPLLTVTVYSALTLIHRSGIRWNTSARLLVLALFGWVGGVIPAVIDGTIRVNLVMHNTLWVPGHFHLYLLLGVLPMVLGFAFHHFAPQRERAAVDETVGFFGFFVGGLLLSLTFLLSGAASIPRRWAIHFPEWLDYAQAGAVAGALAVTGLLLLILRLAIVGVSANQRGSV